MKPTLMSFGITYSETSDWKLFLNIIEKAPGNFDLTANVATTEEESKKEAKKLGYVVHTVSVAAILATLDDSQKVDTLLN